MQGGKLVLFCQLDRAGQECSLQAYFIRAGADKQTPTGDGREGYGAKQFGVIGATRALEGVGPGMVEDELAARMALAVERHRRLQSSCSVTDQDMTRHPSCVRCCGAGGLKCVEELPFQERIEPDACRIGDRVPFVRIDLRHG